LKHRPEFDGPFIDWLAAFRFTGSVRAVPEGTPVFANEPILEVTAPIAEAQLAETFVMNQVHLETLLASKAARVVHAAGGRPVVDFGLRRMHGADAGLKSARAFSVAGVSSTSNVLAGMVYDMPIAGTMAHSYIQAHDDELAAFRAFVRAYPETVLLVDTYDTLDGVRKITWLARELGDDFRVRAIRLDSGDMLALAIASRKILDEAGLERVGIFASGSLDEYRVAELVARGAPIDGFGVGTKMGVSDDAPYLDTVYKLVEYSGRGRVKLSADKKLLPGPKQVFRVEEDGTAVKDVLGASDEKLSGRPLLETVMRGGRRVNAAATDLRAARRRAADEVARLPPGIRALAPADPPYPVELSDGLLAAAERIAKEATHGQRTWVG
jgi:nicotinate phosphoribosyltransferase